MVLEEVRDMGREFIFWGNSLEGLNLEAEQFDSFRHLLFIQQPTCKLHNQHKSQQQKNKETNTKTLA
jgi:hypothetical protein